LKPYLPRYDSLPSAITPEWIDDEETLRPAHRVVFSSSAEESLASIIAETKLTFYSSNEVDLLKSALVEVLAPDIRSLHQRNVGKRSNNQDEEEKENEREESHATQYTLLFDRLEVKFCFPAEGLIEVTSISLHTK